MLTGCHILTIDQFKRADIEQIFQVADRMSPFAQKELITRVLEGAILSNLFFEPSTRTRISFGSAFNLLGGAVRETTQIGSSSLIKGESLQDTAKVLSGYSDVIVMRHPAAGTVAKFAEASRVPVINGGDGDNEHPSQALLDLYTIRSELAPRGRGIEGLKIAMVGDLLYGRAVHSFCKVLALFDDIEYHLVSPKALALPRSYVDLLQSAGHKVVETEQLAQGISQVDIVYLTRTQEERFSNPTEAEHYRGLFRMNQAIYTKYCAPNTAIMHPLPRDSRQEANELDTDLDQNPNLAIFRQTDNAVLVRMAMFALVLGVADKVEQNVHPVTWFTKKRTPSG